MPIIVRQSAAGNNTIIGPCYIYGLMNAEALLGYLSRPWTLRHVQNEFDGYRHPEYVNSITSEVTTDDPRLSALPDDWESIVHESTPCDPPRKYGSRIKLQRELLPNYDPRLTPQMLQERAVRLTKIKII